MKEVIEVRNKARGREKRKAQIKRGKESERLIGIY